MSRVIRITHFSDPGCPWAWSNGPAFAVLQWRYGAQLEWRHVMIGLGETADALPAPRHHRRVAGARLPLVPPSRDAVRHLAARAPARDLADVPRGRRHPAAGAGARVGGVPRLQFAQFTSTLTLDEPAGIEQALAWLPDVDPAALLAAAAEPETEELFAADRALARSAAGGATEFQDRSATTPEGEVRFTAPSLVLTADDGRSLEAGGFQPVEAYDVAIANLDRTLVRRPPAEDAAEVLQAFPDGLTTLEVAAVMAPHLQAPERDAAEDALIAAVAAGAAQRRPFGNDALWTPAAAAAAIAA